MYINSKYIALKEYIPMGKPILSNFELKKEELYLKNTDDVSS